MTSIAIDRRFCGPPNSGNGGDVCGMLARHVGPSAEVTLRRPPPLETPLEVVAVDGGTALRHGEAVVAQARPVDLDVGVVPRVDFAMAEAATRRPVIDAAAHLLPRCFVCGPEREYGDGLRLHAGPVDPALPVGTSPCAAPWVPYDDLTAADGLVDGVFVWSALDCPTGYALSKAQISCREGDPSVMLLGRLAVRIEGRPRPGERCVVVAWPAGEDGRKQFADGALIGESGDVLAIARATWILVERQTQLGTTKASS